MNIYPHTRYVQVEYPFARTTVPSTRQQLSQHTVTVTLRHNPHGRNPWEELDMASKSHMHTSLDFTRLTHKASQIRNVTTKKDTHS